MGQEDFIQMEDIAYFDWSIAATVLTVNKSRGYGTLARTGVGTLTITMPAGRAVVLNDIFLHYIAAGTVMLTCTLDKAASTTTVLQLRVFDNAGAAVDNVPGKAILTRLS